MYHQGKMEQAKEAFEQAIRLHDRNADNYFNLGNVFLSNEKPDFKQAHRNFDRALELEPGNSKLYHAKGLAYQAESEYMSLVDNGIHYSPEADEINV